MSLASGIGFTTGGDVLVSGGTGTTGLGDGITMPSGTGKCTSYGEIMLKKFNDGTSVVSGSVIEYRIVMKNKSSE